MLGLFVDTLTADGKNTLFNKDSLRQPIQMHLYNKKGLFLNLVIHFGNLDQIVNIFKKKMTRS